MSETGTTVPERAPVQDDGEGRANTGGLLADTMQAALELARDNLLDRSLRNKLISTPLKSTKARQVRVFDELSDQVFARLRSRSAFTFTAGRAGGEEADDQVWVPDEGSNLSMTEEELITETARLLGFARTGSDVRSAIEEALADRLLPHLSRDHLGRFRAPA